MARIDRVVLIKTAPDKIIQGQWYHRPWLGLGVLASFLLENGIDCKIIDMHLAGLTKADLLKLVAETGARLFGITSMTHEIERAHDVAKAVKHEMPKSMTVLGGCHVTALPRRTMEEFPAFDYGVHGEGEHTLKELIDCLNNGVSLASVRGLCFRQGDEVVVNQQRDWIEDLDSLPFPAWHLSPTCNEYPLYSSRGCPFRCVFCMRVLGSKVRYRSPENVVDEMEYVVNRFSPERITFQDETFTANLDRANAIMSLITERGLDKRVAWDVNSRVNIGDQAFFHRLKAAGCYKVCLGVESGNERILRRIRKGITKADAERCVSMAKNAGLRTEAYYIFGHPHETQATALETIRFAAKLNTTSAAFGIMVPYPGTEVYTMATQGLGGYRIIASSWKSFNKHLGDSLELERLRRPELEHLQMRAYITFYLHNLRFAELLRFIWSKRAAAVFMLGKLIKRNVNRVLSALRWRGAKTASYAGSTEIS